MIFLNPFKLPGLKIPIKALFVPRLKWEIHDYGGVYVPLAWDSGSLLKTTNTIQFRTFTRFNRMTQSKFEHIGLGVYWL